MRGGLGKDLHFPERQFPQVRSYRVFRHREVNFLRLGDRVAFADKGDLVGVGVSGIQINNNLR